MSMMQSLLFHEKEPKRPRKGDYYQLDSKSPIQQIFSVEKGVAYVNNASKARDIINTEELEEVGTYNKKSLWRVRVNQMNEKQELDKLPEDVVKEINKNIKKGARDIEQKWSNALELVHKAYEVSGIQRPTPELRTAWKQYEEAIAFAVKELAVSRGLDSDWRMSSAVFHEGYEFEPSKKKTFHVVIDGNVGGKGMAVEAGNLDEVIDMIKGQNDYDVKIKKINSKKAILEFSKWGIRKKTHVKIAQID